MLDSGICTAIWSPSNPRNGGHTKGCNLIAFPSINFGIMLELKFYEE